jgi:3-deoxy-D-manno-octulosonic-acid transferase
VSVVLTLYRGASWVLGAGAGAWFAQRARRGKEDSARIGERFARYGQARPAGTLIWLHAASIGESGVALTLIEGLAARRPDLSFLISTGTRTSAELVARRAPPRTTHIYAPLDRIDIVHRFFDHWRPDLGVFVESEVWPNLILEAQTRRVPLVLANARMSPKSLRQWQSMPAAAHRLLNAFSFVSAADARTSEILTALRGAPVPTLGNLKLAAPAPRADTQKRAEIAGAIGARPVWLVASTHGGEEEIALDTHELLRRETPNALMILVPRHPERGGQVAGLASGAPRRSLGATIGDAPVYVADTLGELGVFYELAPVSLVAGSLLPHLKGHNPVEPAKIGSAIVTGPYVESFQDLFDALVAAGGAVKAATPEEIAREVARLWRDDAARARQLEAARKITAQGADAFGATLAQLEALLPRRAQAAAHASA